jgi:predicted kinase
MSFRESIRRRAGRQPSPGRGTCHVSAPQPRRGGSTTTSTYAHRHGGSGTAVGALAAGVPVVVTSVLATPSDRLNARRIAADTASARTADEVLAALLRPR